MLNEALTAIRKLANATDNLADAITGNGEYQNLCLKFADEYLTEAQAIVRKLKAESDNAVAALKARRAA